MDNGVKYYLNEEGVKALIGKIDSKYLKIEDFNTESDKYIDISNSIAKTYHSVFKYSRFYMLAAQDYGYGMFTYQGKRYFHKGDSQSWYWKDNQGNRVINDNNRQFAVFADDYSLQQLGLNSIKGDWTCVGFHIINGNETQLTDIEFNVEEEGYELLSVSSAIVSPVTVDPGLGPQGTAALRYAPENSAANSAVAGFSTDSASNTATIRLNMANYATYQAAVVQVECLYVKNIED